MHGVRRFGVFELESATGELRKRGARIRLQEQPLQILEALLESPGSLVTRDALKERLWPRDPAYRTDDNLNRAVKRLRDALGEGASEPRFVETIRHRGYRFLASMEEESSEAGLSTTTQSTFVGRRRELRYFRKALERTISGEGSVVLLGGEPGVGKTRLAQEVIAEAVRGGAQASFGRCYETEGTPPFIAFSELVERSARRYDQETLRELLGDRAAEVARLVPELSRLLPGIPPLPSLPLEMQRRNLFNGFLAFLRRWSSAAPLVLLIDDLHAADPATLALVDHVADHVSSLSVLILGTYRDAEVDAHPRFAESLHELVRKRLAERVSVPRFDEVEVRDVLRERYEKEPAPEHVERLYLFTDGNAFYLEEVLRDIGEDLDRRDWTIPENVRLVTRRRLGRLTEPCLEVLRGAAVIGRDFDVDLLEAMALQSVPSALEEAVRSRIIRPDSDRGSQSDLEAGYVFEHELIRQSLLQGLSVPRRRRLHLAIGDALERLAPDAVSERARHLRNAGSLVPSARLAETLIAASESAIEAAAAEDALRHATDALSLRAPAEPRLRARLHEARGMALWALERWEEGMADWSEALALFESLADVEGVSRVSRLMNIPLLWMGRFTEVAKLKERVEPLIGNDPTEPRALLLNSRAIGAWMGPAAETAQAMPAIEEAVSISRALESVELEGCVSMTLGTIRLYREEHRLAEVEFERGVSLLRLEGKLFDLVYVLAALQAAHLSLGKLSAVDRAAGETAALADRIGHRGARLFVDRHRAILDAVTTGELGPLKKHLIERELGPTLGDFARNWAYARLALVQFLIGEWDEARDAVERGVALEGDNITRGYALGVGLLLGAYRGEQHQIARFREHASLLPIPGEPARSGQWDFLIRSVEALAMLDELDGAGALYPAMEELTSRGGVTLLWGETLIQKVAGIAAAAGGRWDAAEGHFETALRQASTLPFRVEQPEVRRWHAWMLRLRGNAGDRDRATAFENDAVELYEKLGMSRHAALARPGSRTRS